MCKKKVELKRLVEKFPKSGFPKRRFADFIVQTNKSQISFEKKTAGKMEFICIRFFLKMNHEKKLQGNVFLLN